MERFTLAGLKAELVNDPAGIGYSSAKSAGDMRGLAGLINAQSVASTRMVPRGEAVNYALNQDFLSNIEDAVGDNTMPAPVRRVARNVTLLLCNPDIPALNVGNPNVVAGLAALVSAGVMTQEQSDGLRALANIRISRAEQLWGAGTIVTAEQCAEAIYRTA